MESMGTLPVRIFPQAERISRLVRLGLGAAEGIDGHYDSNGGESFKRCLSGTRANRILVVGIKISYYPGG